MKALSANIKQILDKTNDFVLAHGSVNIDSRAIFITTYNYLKTSSKYKALYTKINELFKKYHIDYNELLEIYLEPFKDNLPLSSNTDTFLLKEVENVLENLEDYAKTSGITCELPDLLNALLDNNYALYELFNTISDKNHEREPITSFDTNDLYKDFAKILAEYVVRVISSLEDKKLKQVLTNINKYVKSNPDLRFIGMDKEFTSLLVALSGRTKKSAVLVGKAGTGKTTLVHKLADLINKQSQELPESLKNKIIYELHLDSLVAGTQFRGQFEQKILNVLDTVAKYKEVILFIDEMHTITKSGGNEGELSAANILKPYLSRGDIQVIGATTDDEFNEYIEKDKAISRRFIKVLVEEPTKEETLEIMRGSIEPNQNFFSKEITTNLLNKIYDLSNQYNLHSANPDKALTMLESAFAYSKVLKENNKEVLLDDVIESVKLKFNINMSNNKVEDTKNKLFSEILGQEKPLDNIIDFLEMIEYNIVDPTKPKCSLMFAGPSGVGKTFASKIIAERFTGSDNNLILVEGSQLQNETAINVLFGSDPGYVGFKQTSDFLAKVKQNPNCVVLFDEIEKAHSSIFKSLLNILDEGYATDKGGNKISFRSAIIIFTTNLGFGVNNKKGTTFMSGGKNEKENAIDSINKHFSPEFLGRLDEIIVFNRLTDSVTLELINRYLKKYNDLSGFNIDFSDEDIKEILENSDINSLGARNIDHKVKLTYLKKVKELNYGRN